MAHDPLAWTIDCYPVTVPALLLQCGRTARDDGVPEGNVSRRRLLGHYIDRVQKDTEIKNKTDHRKIMGKESSDWLFPQESQKQRFFSWALSFGQRGTSQGVPGWLSQ